MIENERETERNRGKERARESESKDWRGEMISVGRIAAVTLWKIQSPFTYKGFF